MNTNLCPCSNDALILGNNYNFFVEFKNQIKKNITKVDLFNRNGSSIATLLGYQLTNLSVLKVIISIS